MLLIDVLVLVAEEELARLREEERRQKAEPIEVCRIKKADRRKRVVSSSDEDGDDDDDGHGNAIAVTAVTRKPKLKFKVKIQKKNCDDGSAKEKEGKTVVDNGPVSTPDLPTNLKNNKKRNQTELDSGANPAPDTPTTSQNKKRKPEADNGPDPPPALPPKFKDMILGKAQGEPVDEAILVIQKKLTKTDVKNHQNRFSIPLNQTRNKFLNEEDEKFIKGRDANGKCNALRVEIIEPQGEVGSVHLSRWVMSKLSGAPCISYVLNGKGWRKMKAYNHLQAGDVVQLWAVQIGGKTCLVFVIVERKKKETIIP